MERVGLRHLDDLLAGDAAIGGLEHGEAAAPPRVTGDGVCLLSGDGDAHVDESNAAWRRVQTRLEPFSPCLRSEERLSSNLPVPRSPSPSSTRLAGLWKRLLARLNAWITDLEYRARGSRPFTVGKGAKRVFYPGCSLPAADPELVLQAYAWLKARDPEVELWSDCCGMPLDKFSTPEAAARGHEQTRAKLRAAGTTELITACGNCTVQFKKLGVPELKITSLYAVLAKGEWGPRAAAVASVVHHPCSARVDKSQQVHFRALADRLGLQLKNGDEKGHPLPCCLTKGPGAQARRDALAGEQLLTYCGHCTVSFQKDIPTRHVLQEVFDSKARWRPRGKLGRFLQYFRLARLASKAGEKR